MTSKSESVRVKSMDELRKAQGITSSSSSSTPPLTTDAEPRLFDMSAFTCRMGSEFTDAVSDFVTEFAGPLIAVYGTRQRVCVQRPILSKAVASSFPQILRLLDGIHTAAPSATNRTRKAEWAVLIDTLASHYTKRMAEKKATPPASTTTSVSSSSASPPPAQPTSGPSINMATFLERFGTWLATNAGREELRAKSSDIRDPYVYRRTPDSWEWNSRFLAQTLFPITFASPMVQTLDKQSRKDLKSTHEWALRLVDADAKRCAAVLSPRDDVEEGEEDASGLPPLPPLLCTAYVEETGFLQKFAPAAAEMLTYLRTTRSVSSVLYGSNDEQKAAEEEEEEEEEADAKGADNDEETAADDEDTESVASLTEKVAQMGIAQPPAAAAATAPEPMTSVDEKKKSWTKNEALETALRRYFDAFPHLQMDCRSVSTLSRDGEGLRSYMFSKYQLMSLCEAVKSIHSLCRYDTSCESAYKRWLFSAGWGDLEHEEFKLPPRPQRTHAWQALFELAQELASMAARMRETDTRLTKIADHAARKKTSGKKGDLPSRGVLCVPWFEYATRFRDNDKGTSTRVAVPVNDYYTAFREGKTATWAAFVTAMKNRLWTLLQSCTCIPHGSLTASDPELDFLITVHNHQSIWNAPIQSHASVFKISAWSGVLPVVVDSFVDRMNTVVHTAVLRARMAQDTETFNEPTHYPSRAIIRRRTPINLCFPLCEPADIKSAHGFIGEDGMAVKRLKDVLASSVALLGAVYKFLLYVGTIAHKVFLCEVIGALPPGSTKDLFETIEYGLFTSVCAMTAVKGEGLTQFVPDHAVYGAGVFGPKEERALKKTPERKRVFVDTVDPIQVFQSIAYMEGRPHAESQSWVRVMIQQRFPDPADDTSGNEGVAMATQLMEDLLNTAALHMTADGWRLHHSQEKANVMRTSGSRLERRRMPLNIFSNVVALVERVRECVSKVIRPRFVDAKTGKAAYHPPRRAPSHIWTERTRADFASHVWAERTDLALSMTKNKVLRSHVLAATKAWWPMGILMCAPTSGDLSLISEFTRTRDAINTCIRRCVVAHVSY